MVTLASGKVVLTQLTVCNIVNCNMRKLIAPVETYDTKWEGEMVRTVIRNCYGPKI